MIPLTIKKQELAEYEEQLKKTKRKKNIIKVADAVATSAGVMSLVCIAISPVALVPLAVFIGVGIYTTKKEQKYADQIYDLTTECTRLNSEIFKASKETKRIPICEPTKLYVPSEYQNEPLKEETTSFIDNPLDELNNEEIKTEGKQLVKTRIPK